MIRKLFANPFTLVGISSFLMAPMCDFDDKDDDDDDGSGYCCCYTVTQTSSCDGSNTTDECVLVDSVEQCNAWTQPWTTTQDGCDISVSYSDVYDGADACGGSDSY